MKNRLWLLLFMTVSVLTAQNINSYEKPPVFPNCESVPVDSLKACFKSELGQYVYQNFQVPQVVVEEDYTGNIKVLFEVDQEGKFKVLYVDAVYQELKDETNRVFENMPTVQPGTYNSNPIFFQYSLTIQIPLADPSLNPAQQSGNDPSIEVGPGLNEVVSAEMDSLNAGLVKYDKREYESQLNIPFTHSYYAWFDKSMNQLGTNSHTAAKPFVYSDVSKYYDFRAEKEALVKGSDSWWSRKLWNEHLVEVQGKDYWFTADPIFDWQVGKDTEADFGTTFNNTRGIYIQGGLGKQLNFMAAVYESQGRFAQYYNKFAEELRNPGSEAAVIPGRGIAKRFKEDAYDYPVAEAYLSYAPAKFFNLQFGHGKNFIGDGYRSLLQSDVASPYPYLKLNTKFWKIKYTNTWMSLRDIRPAVEEDGAFLTKYMANHYLSWNVSKRLNIGLFESVIWQNDNNRGFDFNYLNPVIFYRAIEFQTGQDAGNAIVGATAKYKWNNKINLYSQFILDEFSLGDVRAGNKSWKNKFGYQIGVKYFDAFKVDNLLLQFEYNRVRPYTYSHNSITLNYAHNAQSMAHLWGANFSEALLIGRYHYKRWYGDAKFIFGKRGFDFQSVGRGTNFGGDIFRVEGDRVADTGITVGQGNTTNVFNAELQAGYVINPASNLKGFINVIYRNFDPDAVTQTTFKSNTAWFSMGIRTDLFNWYFDI